MKMKILKILLFIDLILPAPIAKAQMGSSFSIGRMGSTLVFLKDVVYSHKASFLSETAALVDSLEAPLMGSNVLTEATAGRLLVLFAVEPVLEDVRTAYIENTHFPQLLTAKKAYSAKYQVSSWKELPLSRTTTRVSISLLKSALTASKAYVTGDAQLRTYLAVNLKLGKALASLAADSSTGSFTPIHLNLKNDAGFQKLLESIQAHPRTRGLGLSAAMLVEYLE